MASTELEMSKVHFVHRLSGNEAYWQPRPGAESNNNGTINVYLYVRKLDRNRGEWIFFYLTVI